MPRIIDIGPLPLRPPPRSLPDPNSITFTPLEQSEAMRHPLFPAFQEWMRAEKGGARSCPAGAFPQNFLFWLEGGRW